MSSWPERVVLMGCGAMGTAMVAGMGRGGGLKDRELVLVDVVPDAATAAAERTGGTVGSVDDAAAADVVLLAVKPIDAVAALESVGDRLTEDTVVISVVAGLDIAAIRALAARPPIVRLMPNLAVAQGAGLLGMVDDGVPIQLRTGILRLLHRLGTVIPMAEDELPAATALVGSGPGLVALVAEGMEEGAVAVGFSRRDARRMVQAVLAGTAALLADGDDPAALRQRVSSPAGTTVEGLAVLERGAVRAHMADAVRAATRRASEL